MVVTYKYTETNLGKKEVQVETSDQTQPYKKGKYLQPLPGDSDHEILEWAKALVQESYIAKREWHSIWQQNQYDYYCKPTYRQELEVGRDPNRGNRDTEVFIPPLIRRLTDMASCWLTRQIFRAEPFVQFTNYKIEDKELTNIQKLYERKLQGDAQNFRAREKSKQIFTDFILYGSAVLKTEFHQERVMTNRGEFEIKSNSLLAEDESDLFGFSEEFDTEDNNPIEEFDIRISKIRKYFEVVDQYAMFNPIFLGNFIIDPSPKYGDWRNAAYMGDISYVCEEELYDMFGGIPKFRDKFHEKLGGYTSNFLPFSIGLDPFVASRLMGRSTLNRVSQNNWGRKQHSILYLETPKTQTCIVDEDIVVYHRFRNPKEKKMGAWSYELLRYPVTSGGLWGVGYGSILKQLQKEQRYLASKRLQYLEKMHKPYIEVLDDTVDESKIKELKDCIMVRVSQPGGLSFRLPPAGAEELYLNSEARNMTRAREYAGIPAMLDGSSDKTHMTGIPQRLEAAQVQFDVLLDIARDTFKSTFQKIHVLNMAYLDGDLPIYGAAGVAEKNTASNSLSEDQLQKLKNSDLVLQLNAGINVNDEKLKEIAQLMNTAPIAEAIQGLSPINKQIFIGQLFDMSGNTEFKRIFELNAQELAQQQMSQPPQAMMGMPPAMGGQEPAPLQPPMSMPSNLPPGMM